MFKKVIVGMSGGVDSAVAALLLKRKGFDVTGVFMKNWDLRDETDSCVSDAEYEDAQWVCNKLKIPLVEVNFVKEYWNNVFSYLTEMYENGCTPNPDIICNKHMKFDKFFHFARTNLQADAIATGHYVRTSFGPYLEHFISDANVCLLKAEDTMKDQTLFLSQVPQEALRYSMFPVGEYLKSNIKKIAEEAGLDVVLNKKESTGICFVGKRKFQRFISEYMPEKEGRFVDLENGQVVGVHKGFHHWTVGQGCKIPGVPNPYYVYRKETKTNNILVVAGTNHPALYSDMIRTEAPHWISKEPLEFSSHYGILSCDFRFQHQDELIPCTVSRASNNQLIIKLSKPLRALTKGQFAVLYKGEECLGSGTISHHGPSYYMLGKELTIEHCQEHDTKGQETVYASI